jgi:hypothetical protein
MKHGGEISEIPIPIRTVFYSENLCGKTTLKTQG